MSICKVYFTFSKNNFTMYKQLLLPSKYSFIEYFLFIPAAIAHLFFTKYNSDQLWRVKFPVIVNDEILKTAVYFKFTEVPLFNTIFGILALTGLVFIAFAKVKHEDEYTNSLRLNSWQWSVLINCFLLLFCFLFIYGLPFFAVMFYNMYSILLIFIIRFKYLLYKNNK